MLRAKQEAIYRFAKGPLKNPASKHLLQALLEDVDLIERISFVSNREFLANTMLIAESGSGAPAFELELGAHQREEVSIVNGRLVRHTHRTRAICIHDPMEALRPLREFKGRLYLMFAFAREVPAWYQMVEEPNPALPLRAESRQSIEATLDEIVREQVELALLAITLREELDRQLRTGDEAGFRRTARLYNEVVQRCLWEL